MRVTLIKVDLMKQVLFGNPVFDLPIMTTVRNGDKWFVDLEVGDKFEICDASGTPTGQIGQVLFQDCGSIFGLHDVWIEINHDPAARTPDGLREAMAAAYPSGWNCEEVSTIGFRIVS